VKLVKSIPIGGSLITTIVTGDVGSVRAAVEAGKEAATRVGNLVGSHIIARPSDGLLAFFTA
jgi:ethanolamine utilization protein EutM